jgi:hypothetical protein
MGMRTVVIVLSNILALAGIIAITVIGWFYKGPFEEKQQNKEQKPPTWL